VLQEFVDQHRGNSARVFVEDGSEVAVAVVFQSARMNRLFRAFPEVMLVDTTHGTNANQYKLLSFAVTDIFGKVMFATETHTGTLQISNRLLTRSYI